MNLSLDYNGSKGFRLLNIYERLNKGEIIEKVQLAENFGVTPKTIQRDIDDLRAYLAETHSAENEVSIKYDKIKNGYYLLRFDREWLTNEEVLALCKILLESRAFQKNELNILIKKMMTQVVPNDRKNVEIIINNEIYNYTPLRHGKRLLTPIWELSQYIVQNQIVSFEYTRQDGQKREHKVKPVAIMFSEFYFYLISFMADDSKEFPTVFRIDRLKNLRGMKEKFNIPYRNRFEDGEFRKRVQFMYSGELKTVIFEYSGLAIESVLDRLPTAQIISQNCAAYTIKSETYGDGIYMWLRSQGETVKIIN